MTVHCRLSWYLIIYCRVVRSLGRVVSHFWVQYLLGHDFFGSGYYWGPDMSRLYILGIDRTGVDPWNSRWRVELLVSCLRSRDSTIRPCRAVKSGWHNPLWDLSHLLDFSLYQTRGAVIFSAYADRMIISVINKRYSSGWWIVCGNFCMLSQRNFWDKILRVDPSRGVPCYHCGRVGQMGPRTVMVFWTIACCGSVHLATSLSLRLIFKKSFFCQIYTEIFALFF